MVFGVPIDFKWLCFGLGFFAVISLGHISNALRQIVYEIYLLKIEFQSTNIDIGALRQRYAPERLDY